MRKFEPVCDVLSRVVFNVRRKTFLIAPSDKIDRFDPGSWRRAGVLLESFCVNSFREFASMMSRRISCHPLPPTRSAHICGQSMHLCMHHQQLPSVIMDQYHVFAAGPSRKTGRQKNWKSYGSLLITVLQPKVSAKNWS